MELISGSLPHDGSQATRAASDDFVAQLLAFDKEEKKKEKKEDEEEDEEEEEEEEEEEKVQASHA